MAYKVQKIKGDLRKTLTKEFYKTREELDPFLSNLKMKDIKVMLWEKPERTTRGRNTIGKCFRGSWRIQTRTASGRKSQRWFTNLILLSKQYYENNPIEDVLAVFRHELVHLIEPNHGTRFHSLARACNAHNARRINK